MSRPFGCGVPFDSANRGPKLGTQTISGNCPHYESPGGHSCRLILCHAGRVLETPPMWRATIWAGALPLLIKLDRKWRRGGYAASSGQSPSVQGRMAGLKQLKSRKCQRNPWYSARCGTGHPVPGFTGPEVCVPPSVRVPPDMSSNTCPPPSRYTPPA